MSKNKITWKTEKRKLEQLNPYAHNPRRLTEKGMADLKRSIDKFGLAEPIIINTDNTIIGGHARYFTLLKDKNADIMFVDCYVPSKKLTPKEVQELNIRLNKNIAGEFDFDILANNFELTDLLDWGFEENEIDLNLWNNKTDEQLDDMPEQQKEEKEAVSKLGDIFLIDGKHRIMCGDSTKKEDVEKLMNGEKANLGFTSPPYWVGKDYETQKSIDEINFFIKETCSCYNFAVKKDKSRIVINTGTGFTTSFDKKKKRQVLLLIDKWTNYFFELGWNLRHIRHWIKEGQLSSTSPKTDLIDQHCEFLGTYENDDGEILKFDDEIDEQRVNLLEVFYNTSGINRGQERTKKKWALRAFWDDIKGNSNQTGHIAAFPVELPLRHILLYTKKNEIVLDLFLGSGSTLIACEQTNRICYGMEIDPIYIDVILRRYYNLYPKKKIECLTRDDFNLSQLFNNDTN